MPDGRRGRFQTYDDFVPQTVSSKVNLVATDETFRYRNLNRLGYKHDFVTHRSEEYVRGKVHTQTIESFWSLLRRGIMGSYHKVAKDYLPLVLERIHLSPQPEKRDNPFAELISNVYAVAVVPSTS